MRPDTPLGEVWGFRQMSEAGAGYWYRISRLARTDEAGRALAKVMTTPFRTFTGNIIICPPGTPSPGAPPNPSYPVLRRAGTIDNDPDAVLGLMWGHSATYRNGKGYPAYHRASANLRRRYGIGGVAVAAIASRS
jgi:hypothetical protein